MTAHPHPFIAAAAALFDEQGWTYQLTAKRMTSGFANPLRHSVVFGTDKNWVVLTAKLAAPISDGNVIASLNVANGFNLMVYGLQAYVAHIRDEFHPAATIALPAFVFDETHATKTVALFVSATIQWVEWWMEHADLLELSPAERWRQAGVKNPWADLLAEAGFLPEDADGVDDIEAFAMEIFVEHCSAVDPPPHT